MFRDVINTFQDTHCNKTAIVLILKENVNLIITPNLCITFVFYDVGSDMIGKSQILDE